MQYKLIEIQPDGLILEDDQGLKLKTTLDWFAENFIIIENLKGDKVILSCGYEPITNNN